MFTACSSRHCYVHLCFSQTTEEVIAGFEEAWAYFGAVFPVVIPDYVPRNIIVAHPAHGAPEGCERLHVAVQERFLGLVGVAGRPCPTPTGA